MKLNMKKIGIGCIMLVLVALLGVASWLMLRDKTTEGTQTAKNSLGIEWYDENGKEFTITTVEELYEFGELSYHYDFAGQTIKLGADIVVNEGDAADWVDVMPEREWESIYGFAGTFDGQGHTISGIYCNGFLYQTNKWRVMGTDHVTAGLFRNTQKECVIKNLKLVNSYFYSDLNSGVGSISSYGGGTFDSIYTDAIVISEKLYVGGIMGRATADTTITNCWFDGSVEVVGGYGRYTGGILGRADSKTKCKIEHCLNSGTMTSDLYKRGVNMGGILGQSWESEVEMNDCLVTGTLHNDWIVVGSVMGNVGTDSTVKMKDVYTITEAFDETVGYLGGKLTGYPVDFSKELLTGIGGYQWTTLDFDKYWTVVEDGTPILQTFADKKVSVEGVAKNVDTSWYNEEESTYVLNDFADLYGFAIVSRLTDFADKTVKLGADITINSGKAADWAKEAPAYGWMPIGSTTLPFAGTFDGQKHTISGIYLKTDATYSGFFGVTETTSKIKNLSLKNSYFETTANSFGSIAGRGKGVFDTIYSDAIVVGDAANIGGLVGQVPGKAAVKMNNCWFDGSATNNTNDKSKRGTGGLIGTVLSDATITNCLNTGTISAPAYTVTNSATSKSVAPRVGGLVGCVDNKATATISYCLNTGKIKCSSAATAGHGSIVGSSNSLAKITNTFATSESCKNTALGTVEGQAIVYDEAQLIGYGGYKWTTLDFQKYWSVVLDGTSILKSFAKKVPSLNGVARMVDISWYSEKANTYVLNDADDLYGLSVLAKSNDFAGKTVKLGADINVNNGNASEWAANAPENAWMCIGNNTLPFAGTFDGQMHTISGLYLKTDESYAGLFGVTDNKSTVKNVSLKNSYFESSAPSVGSIAGRGKGAFDTVYSDAIVVSSVANAGGIVGQIPGKANASLNNCWFDGTVTNTSNDRNQRSTGGLVGVVLSDAKISNCLNTGTIDVTAYTVTNSATSKSVAPRAGGLVGCVDNKATATITGCMNVGDVKTSSAASAGFGSIVGSSNSLVKVENTFATKESCANTAVGTVEGKVIVYAEDKIVGYGGYQWTTLDFDKYWSVVLDDTSVLKSFATDVPNLSGVARMLDISWYDEASKKPYTISDAADLYGLALLSETIDFAGKTIQLSDDIEEIIINDGNADDWKTNAPAYEWEGIGSSDVPFAGTFNGNGKTISGVYVNADASGVGFFNYTSDKATIKNLKLTNSYFNTAKGTIGSIVGQGDGKFDTIYSNAYVDGTTFWIGGLIGRTATKAGITMNNCWFDGEVTQTGTGNANQFACTGGLVGLVYNGSSFTNCLNTGDVTAYYTANNTPCVAGLVGRVNTGTITLESCVNTGVVTVDESATGNYGPIVGVSSASRTSASNTFAMTEHFVDGESIAPAGVTKIAEEDLTGTDAIAGTFNLDYDKYWVAATKTQPILKAFDEFAEGEVLEIDTSWYDGSKNYTLKDVSDLYGFALLSYKEEVNGFDGDVVSLAKDIESITLNAGTPYGADGVKDADDDQTPDDWSKVAPDYEWPGIGTSALKFAGTFNGNMKAISGVYMSANASYVGFFNYTNSLAIIKNVKLMDSYFFTTKGAIASIVGQGDGTFDTIYSNAIVDGTRFWIGGLVGRTATSAGVTMNNCWFDGKVTQLGGNDSTGEKASTGGLVGLVYNGSRFTNCLNTGEVTAYYKADETPCVAGLAGRVHSGTLTVKNCLNTGVVTVDASATGNYGPIIGVGTAARISASDTFALTEHYVDGESIAPAGVTNVSKDVINGTDALTSMSKLFRYKTAEGQYKNYWAVVPGKAPVLESFASEAGTNVLTIDTSWYKESDKDLTEVQYTLSNRDDFYGFAVLSNVTNFANAEIKLSDHIEVNAGTPYGADGVKDADDEQTPDDWSRVAPDYEWPCTGTFAGEFNGNNKKISGIYLNTTLAEGDCKGLFSVTTANANIHNLALVNSYFQTNGLCNGSIAGRVQGGIYNSIYSNAIVVGSNQNLGGLIGQHQNNQSNLTMKNCWFDGSVTNNFSSSANESNTGGLIGAAFFNSTITSCLNTGAITSKCRNTNPAVGGLVGATKADRTVAISYCLNQGAVNYETTATTGYGRIVGSLPSATSSLTDCYSTNPNPCSSISRGAATTLLTNTDKIEESAIKADVTKTKANKLLLYSENPWVAVAGSMPIPKTLEFVLGIK